MYGVFLSYSGQDRALVQKLAVYLADDAKLNPWFDQWFLIPGQSWIPDLQKGLEDSLSCAVFIGKSGQASWQQPEVEAAIQRHVRDKGFRIIPVLLPGAPPEPKLPAFLPAYTWVDFRNGLDDDNALWRLECGIRGIPPGPGRPKNPEQPTITTTVSSVNVAPLNI